MAKEITHDVCAFIKGPDGGKNSYPRIGMAMTDEQGRLSIKIDTLPLTASGWTGWVNLFPKDESRTPKKTKPAFSADNFPDDDIPF